MEKNSPKVKTYQKLNKFLEGCKVNKEDTFTHVSMCNPPGRYFISDNDYDKFSKYYKKAMAKGSTYHICEVTKPYAPIVCDIDFNVSKKHYSDKRCYDNNTVKLLVRLYNDAIQKYLNIPHNKLQAFIMEKKEATDEGSYYKDGIHIIYPFICTQYEIRYAIRNEVIETVNSNELFKELKLINSIEQVFDKQCLNGTWLLYGSVKKNATPTSKYALTKILAHDETDLDLNTYSSDELVDVLSVRKFNNSDEDDFQEDIDKASIINKYTKNVHTTKVNEKLCDKTEEEDKMVKALVNLLNIDRVDSYQSWMELGWCLYNISPSYMNLWIGISFKSKKFVPGECEQKWANMTSRDDGFTIRSLYRWAKEDNPIEYNKLIKANYNEKIENSLTGNSYLVAKAMYTKYQDNYVCSSLKHKTWHEFKDHRWVEIDEGYTLFTKISEEFVDDYSRKEIEYNEKAINTTGLEKETWQKRKEQVSKIVSRLRDISFKEAVMKENRILFYDPEFEDKLDEQRHLIGFNNGIYDLDQGLFRSGRPEDYVSLTTNIDYEDYKPNSKYAKKINTFFKQIQPKEDMRNYVLKLYSSYLQGHIPDEKFHIATGSGSNGKSLSIDLLMYALGEYAITLPITILIKKRNASNAASPELAMIKGRRFGVFQEPEGNDKIHVGQMKELTGGDKFMARPLFKDPIEVKPQIKLLLTCNNLPHIPARDNGTWRRIRVVEHGSEFVDNPVKPNQFQIDRTLKQDIENWAPQFMAILLETFKDYKVNGLVEPQQVVQFTKKYEQDSDHFLEFVNENIEDSNSAKDYVTISSVWETFKRWFKDVHPDVKQLPSRSELKGYMEVLYGKPAKGGRWLNKVLKIEDDSDDEEDNVTITQTKSSKSSLDM